MSLKNVSRNCCENHTFGFTNEDVLKMNRACNISLFLLLLQERFIGKRNQPITDEILESLLSLMMNMTYDTSENAKQVCNCYRLKH